MLDSVANIRETEPDKGMEAASEADIRAIVTRGKGKVDAELIQACPNLRVIARCGVGLDNVDVKAASGKGVPVINAPGSNAATVAEHTLALMLMLQRKMYDSIRAVKEGRWAWRNQYEGDEIRGKTLGILGLGNIGSRVANLAEAFGMKVIYWDVARQNTRFEFYSLGELLRDSDIVSIHLPLVPGTEKLIDGPALDLIGPDAFLVNCARGGIVDQEAVREALEEGRLGAFAADVLDPEPPTTADRKLLERPDVLITPHSASLTAKTFNDMCVSTVRNVMLLLEDEPVDPQVIFNRHALAR